MQGDHNGDLRFTFSTGGVTKDGGQPADVREDRQLSRAPILQIGPYWRSMMTALCVLWLAATIPGTSRAGEVVQAYDILGRLVAVVDTSILSGINAASYSYDAVGNLIQITNFSATTVTFFSYQPHSGPAGVNFQVIIYGDGFSPTPSQNIVKFNGTVAVVTASNVGMIKTTVPAGATSGPLTVAPAQTAPPPRA